MVNKDVSFAFNISDGSTVVGHSFVRRISIRSTVETLRITVENNFLHVWTVRIGQCILDKIFPTLCLGLVDCLVSFTTSVYPLQAILMDRLTEANLNTDFGSNMWNHPRF